MVQNSSCRSDGFVEREHNGEKDDVSNDQDISNHQHYVDGQETITRCYELKFARVFGGWFSYRKLGSSPGSRNPFSSRWTNGFLGCIRSIVRLCSSNKLNPQKDPLEEV